MSIGTYMHNRSWIQVLWGELHHGILSEKLFIDITYVAGSLSSYLIEI